jgi:DNA primase
MSGCSRSTRRRDLATTEWGRTAPEGGARENGRRADKPAILTEGEFDALLLWQEAGDLFGVAMLGSCNRGVSAKALRYLLGCPRLLVAYDVDAEGERGAERLGQLSSRV